MIYYYIVDTETTGMKTGYHEINQISVLRMTDGTQVSAKIAVDFPNRANPVSLDIQGITKEDLLVGENKKDALNKIHDFINEDGSSAEHRCMVAHNASFDKRFCHIEWEGAGLVFPAHLWLCTKTLSRKFIKARSLEARVASAQGEPKVRYGLEPLLKGLGLPIKTGAHDAEVDTVNCKTLFDECKQGTEYVSCIKREPHKEEKKPKDELDVSDF